MRNSVSIADGELVVEPVGLDKLWSFTSSLRIPLEHVRGATHDPGMRHEPKGWRGPGLGFGSKLSGTFHADGDRQFWNVSGFDDAVVIELVDEEYNRLILSIDDPAAVVDEINNAVAEHRRP